MSFDVAGFTAKLTKLSNTPDSIQTLASWCIFHKAHTHTIVNTWNTVILQFNTNKQYNQCITLLYLCNELIQSKIKPNDYVTHYTTRLPTTLRTIYTTVDTKYKGKIERLITIWSDRNVFDKQWFDNIRTQLKLKPTSTNSKPTTPTQSATVPKSTSGATVHDELIDLYSSIEASNTDDTIATKAQTILDTDITTYQSAKLATPILIQYRDSINVQIYKRNRLIELMQQYIRSSTAVLSESTETLNEVNTKLNNAIQLIERHNSTQQTDTDNNTVKKQKTSDSSEQKTDHTAHEDQYKELLASLATIRGAIT